jgi:hypothetical protein
MDEQQVFDLTPTMEGFISEGLPQLDIMRELLKIAEETRAVSGYHYFRIGEDVYSLQQLEEIQKLEEHEVLFKRR